MLCAPLLPISGSMRVSQWDVQDPLASHPVVSNFPAFQVSGYHLPQLCSHLADLQSPSFCLYFAETFEWSTHY